MGTVHAKERPFEGDRDAKPRFGGGGGGGGQHQKINLENANARVDQIHINGLNRTKDDVVEASIKDLFKANNFKDVLIKADRVRTRLDALGCFSNIGIFVDVSRGPNASPDGVEVTFHVEELKRITGGVNTTVGNNTGSLVIGMKAPNIGGRGERIQCEYSRSFKQFSNWSLSFTKPYPYYKYEPVLCASLIQQLGEFPKSGYKQLDRGILLDVGFRTSPKAYHNLQWEGLFRDTSALSRATSFAVRESAGPTMKSAIRYIGTIDSRDERIFPTRGNLLQVTSELSGIGGGSMSFFKNDVYFQTNYSILGDILIQGTAQTGLLNNFHGTNLTEHFYMGGPLSVRGFDLRGIGPQSDGSALGSNLLFRETPSNVSKFYWASGLHVYTPLPFRPGKGGIGDKFKTHFFVNAGNIGPIKDIRDMEANLDIIKKNIRMTAGLGIALKIGDIARFELNYCFPLRYVASDVTSPGLQFGLGVNFL